MDNIDNQATTQPSMDAKLDRRIRKTRTLLKNGLAELLEKKSIRDIKVKELVEYVDINRSTFYLHYTDIYDMLNKIEQELTDDILKAFDKHPLGPTENNELFIQDILEILAKNRPICKALIGPNGDMSFILKLEELIATHAIDGIAPFFKDTSRTELRYTYAYCLNGCVGIVKDWLLSDGEHTPTEMTEIIYKMLKTSIIKYL